MEGADTLHEIRQLHFRELRRAVIQQRITQAKSIRLEDDKRKNDTERHCDGHALAAETDISHRDLLDVFEIRNGFDQKQRQRTDPYAKCERCQKTDIILGHPDLIGRIDIIRHIISCLLCEVDEFANRLLSYKSGLVDTVVVNRRSERITFFKGADGCISFFINKSLIRCVTSLYLRCDPTVHEVAHGLLIDSFFDVAVNHDDIADITLDLLIESNAGLIFFLGNVGSKAVRCDQDTFRILFRGDSVSSCAAH